MLSISNATKKILKTIISFLLHKLAVTYSYFQNLKDSVTQISGVIKLIC